MPAWSSIYLGFIALGWGLLLLSLAFGWGHHGAAHHGDGTALFQIGVLAPFCIWAGAAGHLLTRGLDAAWWLVLGCALAVGSLGAAAVRAFARQLLRREAPIAAGGVAIGTLAVVSDAIHCNGTGEIELVQRGRRRWFPGRGSEGSAIAHGTEVVVVGFTSGIAEVTPLDD